MPDAPVLSPTGKSAKKVSLDQDAFGARFNESLVHQCVRAEQAARRRGTASTKTRAEVSGGGSKPFWRQGFLPPPRTSARVFCALVPERPAARYAFTT